MGFFSSLFPGVAPSSANFRGGAGGGGPQYNPSKPWALAQYRSGGGRPKAIDFFATQEQAAAALRGFIADVEVDDRQVAIVEHLPSARDLQKLSDRSMDRSEYRRLADAQQFVAQKRGYSATAATAQAVRAARSSRDVQARIVEVPGSSEVVDASREAAIELARKRVERGHAAARVIEKLARGYVLVYGVWKGAKGQPLEHALEPSIVRQLGRHHDFVDWERER
jgi:hypothetical protein